MIADARPRVIAAKWTLQWVQLRYRQVPQAICRSRVLLEGRSDRQVAVPRHTFRTPRRHIA